MSKVKIIKIGDKVYPKLLKEIPNPPQKLWIKGEILPQDSNAIAVVGARKVTSYGRQVTESLVPGLTAAGLTIVSGMARGVDSIAHSTALAAGGRTIAVLGSGVDVVYPSENKTLYQKIIQNGAVISEFEPGTPPLRENFPVRNRIIAGLSLGVLVTEAAEKSGSLITAGFAGDFGREVFAVPGPVYSAMTEGTANLIKDGAKLVYRAQDILEELNLETIQLRSSKSSFGGQARDSVEGKIFGVLEDGPKHVDEIIKELTLPASQVIAALSLLEISGKVKNLGSGVYGVKR